MYSCDKVKIHGIVAKAVKSGELEKPDVCSECGVGGRIQGHHEDYDKPLEVIWLCQKCHMGKHKKGGPWYLSLPSVKEIPDITKMDECLLEDYIFCTYSLSEQEDLLRGKTKRTIKFYDNRGYIVWKEEYYL
jgi:hypothetical protein